MKKNTLFLVILVLAFLRSGAQSAYDLSFNTLDGNPVRVSQFAAHKILFMVVPLNQQDSIYQQVTSFASHYRDSLTIIGIISIDDGYNDEMKESVKNLYAGTGIILTEGMHIRKSSSAQSLLLQWLTDRTKNRHFDHDADQVGIKYFVAETGRLFAVLERRTNLLSPFISRIINTPVSNNN